MSRRIKSKHFILALILLSNLAFYTFNPPKTNATGYELVGTNPYAAAQPTDFGKTIWALEVYNGKLYPGYGDYGTNTGPIKIAPYDPNSGTFSLEWTENTQEIDTFTAINGKLFAPATDSGSNNYAEGLPWADHGPVGSTHIFGMTTLTGTDLWMAGSFNLDAMVWHSTDGGATWQTALDFPSPGGGSDFSRFYFIGAYNGKIYVQAQENGSNATLINYSMVWNGSSWSHGPDFGGDGGVGWKAASFAGKMLILKGESYYPRQLAVFDGTTVSKPADQAQLGNYTISGSYLYTVDSSCNIRRTQDLSNWETIGVGCPTNVSFPAASIAVLGNYVYTGGSGANIYRLQLPSSSGAAGDTNGDGHVNAADLTTFQGNYNTTATFCDFNHDGTVNVLDFSILLAHYGS